MKFVEGVRATADRIINLEIKGARNVAIAALQALKADAENTKAKTRHEFMHELSEARKTLFVSRPTEPFMRNAITFVIGRVNESSMKKVAELSSIVSSSSQEFLESLEQARNCIAEIGAKRIQDGMTIFTHCRSSTVTCLLRKAKKSSKKFSVICTETRPVFQGRLTARELLDMGINTTLIVDSAARSSIKQADIVLVGADAITSDGNVINKIGTASIAILAEEARVPFYVASELLKFDAATQIGEFETIEERSRDEVWTDSPPNLIIKNPAFEVVRRDFIHALICEEGIIPPHIVSEVIRRKYPWIFKIKP